MQTTRSSGAGADLSAVVARIRENPDDLRAREALFHAVNAAIPRMVPWRGSSREDLLQAARMGAWGGVLDFDPNSDASPLAHSLNRARWAALAWWYENRSPFAMHLNTATKAALVDKQAAQFEAHNKRPPTEDELAQLAGVRAETIRRYRVPHRLRVVDTAKQSDDDPTTRAEIELCAGGPDPEAVTVARDLRARVVGAVRRMKPEHARAVAGMAGVESAAKAAAARNVTPQAEGSLRQRVLALLQKAVR